MKLGSRGIGDDEEPTPLFITEQVKWTLLLFTLTTVTLQESTAVVLIGTSGSSDLDEKVLPLQRRGTQFTQNLG
jgi:hypothetical protein